jgi:hypothetical protein
VFLFCQIDRIVFLVLISVFFTIRPKYMKELTLTESRRKFHDETGASLFELLVVVVIATIMSGVSIFYFSGNSKMFKPDDQSLKLIDLLQEARQRSLTQRETIRVEIDLTDNIARIIDENTASTETDDKKVREITLYPGADVKLDSLPPDITLYPPDPLATTAASFQISVYPPSVTHNVCTLRFMRDGTVYNAGTNPTASGATLTSATLFIWSPKANSATQSEVARAITIVGTTGSMKLWDYNRTSTDTNKWKDSRRTGVYGSGSTPTPTP